MLRMAVSDSDDTMVLQATKEAKAETRRRASPDQRPPPELGQTQRGEMLRAREREREKRCRKATRDLSAVKVKEWRTRPLPLAAPDSAELISPPVFLLVVVALCCSPLSAFTPDYRATLRSACSSPVVARSSFLPPREAGRRQTSNRRCYLATPSYRSVRCSSLQCKSQLRLVHCRHRAASGACQALLSQAQDAPSWTTTLRTAAPTTNGSHATAQRVETALLVVVDPL